MLEKVMDIFNLATGIIMAVSSMAFVICSAINNEVATLVCGVALFLVGGMYIATTILKIIGKYFTKK